MKTRIALLCVVLWVGGLGIEPALGQNPQAPDSLQANLTCRELRARLEAKPQKADAEELAKAVREWFGAANLAQGANPKTEDLYVAWAIELSQPPEKSVQVIARDGLFSLALSRIGDTNVYASVTVLPSGEALTWHYDVDGKAIAPAPQRPRSRRRNVNQLEVYAEHPDNQPRNEVVKGKLIEQPPFASKIFEGTKRAWWIYVPAQYKDEQPACVMVFQDGAGYKDFVPTVFDNLIAKGDMPVTVGVFINPGTFDNGRSNRSFEYDTLSDAYARFLLEEILPEVEKTWKLKHDPESRAIAGISSGGICAWTVAWERPDEFRKVLSWVGSFTNIASGKTVREGGHNYPALIRKTPRKPIRVFLQDGANDLDNANGNWPLANQQMAKALEFSKYDYEFVYGNGFHSNKHGRAILPDSLRWLWRDWRDAAK